MALGNPPSGNTFRGQWPGAYSTLKKTTLKYKSPHTVNVKWLQQALNYRLGGRYVSGLGTVPVLSVDGDFGIKTEGVVRGFQQVCQVYLGGGWGAVDGIVGPKTWAALNTLITNPRTFGL